MTTLREEVELALKEIDVNAHHGVVPADLAKRVMLDLVQSLIRIDVDELKERQSRRVYG